MKDEALKLALKALVTLSEQSDCDIDSFTFGRFGGNTAITAIKEALAQPAQDPAGLIESLKDAKPCCGRYETCYRACTPRGKFLGQRDAQRPWVGIDWSEIPDEEFDRTAFTDGATWAERYLKEKNS